MSSSGQRQKLLAIEQSLEQHPFPPQLVVETTSRCNMKCLHCSHKEMKRARADMAEEIFKKIIEEVASEMPDCEIWPTFYGEALLLGEKLWRWLDYAAKAGCQNLVLNSNGIMLAKPGMIERVLDSPLRRFILSLDGYTKKTFEKIRVGGNRDKIYQAVERLLEARQRRGARYPIIQCQFSVMTENKSEVEDFKAYWRARGAEVKLRQMFTWTSTGSISVPGLKPSSDFRIACPWGNNAAAIHQNGNLVACAVDYEGRFVAGNVKDKTIKNLWQGEHKAKLRQPHRNHDWQKIPEVCQGCPDWQVVGSSYLGPEDQTAYARPFWYYDSGKKNTHAQD